MEPVNTHFPERIDEHYHLIKINQEILHPDNWTLIPETGCWAWNWYMDSKNRYPMFTCSFKSTQQREYYGINVRTYMMAVTLPNRLMLLETCSPNCINPDHFESVVNASIQRIWDKKHGSQVLSPEEAWFIKFIELKYDEETGKGAYRYYGQGKDLAEKYGVAAGVISGIKRGKKWRFLDIDDFDYIGEE